MTSEDDAAMLAKISRIAGEINRHKNGQVAGSSGAPNSSAHATNSGNHPAHTWHPARGVYRGRARGYARGGRSAPVRNRTLVLNGGGTPTNEPARSDENQPTSATQSASQPATTWVTRNDVSSKQLINPAIYQKHSEDRAKAAEETRKLKLRQRDERERAKLKSYFSRVSASYSGPARPSVASGTAPREIVIQDIRFYLVKNGSKLVKVPGDANAAKATPKTAVITGIRFYRSKSGNMYRSGIVKAQRGRRIIKKIDEQCKTFSNTGTCLKGNQCPYNHDPQKVGICKDFLQKGTCAAGDSCDLSHDPTPENSPHCLYFAKGHCSNANCRYAHVIAQPSAPVCRSFGIYGYCEKGALCPDRHVHECPDFSNTGTCKTKGCKLLHRLKASVIRKNGGAVEAEASDISSDDEEIGSDDVDSDDLEEFFGNEVADKDGDIPMQQDFVRF